MASKYINNVSYLSSSKGKLRDRVPNTVKRNKKVSFELKKDLGKELNFCLCIDRHQRGQENEKLG